LYENIHLTAFFQCNLGKRRKGEPFLILPRQAMMDWLSGWQWHQL